MNRRDLVRTLAGGGLMLFASPALAQLGGWTNAKVDDPEVVAAAKFALQETKKKNSKLKLEKIVAAKHQLVAGMNYWVSLQLSDSASGMPVKRKAEAVIYKNLDDEYSLTSWKWKKD